jgi:hypothetical protein
MSFLTLCDVDNLASHTRRRAAKKRAHAESAFIYQERSLIGAHGEENIVRYRSERCEFD